ncbi:MAG: hypothetical protein WBN22_09850 [Verrucomicrobiia bacterium]
MARLYKPTGSSLRELNTQKEALTAEPATFNSLVELVKILHEYWFKFVKLPQDGV